MTVVSFVILGLLLVLVVYGTTIFNGLVALRENVKKSWSNIDVLLLQRHDEIPKLVEICKGYMKHERETLDLVMKARSAAWDARERDDVAGVGAAETQMRAGLGRLFALSENYPDLKANDTFMHLQARISSIEDQIADRRELYNDAATLKNTRIQQVPDMILARMFNFATSPLLEFEEAALARVDVGALFSERAG